MIGAVSPWRRLVALEVFAPPWPDLDIQAALRQEYSLTYRAPAQSDLS